ncbi:YesL family protein [Paenibacillus sp. SAF-054]|uniref:YesL family protein n=1 Tax=unclassified Paenibacillus TaxID=185978 RepID=UPI003F7FF780
MEFKGAMGGIYKITEWITRFAYSNILWLLCSSPFFFFLVTKLLVTGANESLQMNWAMGIVAPFTLFPATAALFAVVRKWVMGDPDVKIFSMFFRSYKENYKQSMIGGIFYVLLLVIMLVDYTVYMTQFSNLQIVGIVMLILLIVLFVSLFNFFSMIVHYHMGILQVLKNAVLITIIRPLRVITTVVGSAVVLFIGAKYPAIIFFFGGSLIAYWAFFNFYATFTKMQDQAERIKQKELEEQEAAELEGNSDEEDFADRTVSDDDVSLDKESVKKS